MVKYGTIVIFVKLDEKHIPSVFVIVWNMAINHNLQLKELMEYHEITEVYKNSVACFRLGSSLVNIDTVSPTFADMFSLLLVQSGEAVFSINSREYTVVRGDLLLLSPSILVAITGQSADFVAMNLMCDRSFFEHLLSLNIAYQSYSLFFCRTDFPVIHLSEEQAETIAASMRQISETISYVCVYQENILHYQLHVLLLQVLELVEGRVRQLPASLNHNEELFHRFVQLLIQHYRQEHYIDFYAGRLSISSTYLSRVIRKVTQKTAGYFISGLLYAEACRMLTYTDETVQSIADQLNFSDQSAFGKFFKSKSGISPQQYRTDKRHKTSDL